MSRHGTPRRILPQKKVASEADIVQELTESEDRVLQPLYLKQGLPLATPELVFCMRALELNISDKTGFEPHIKRNDIIELDYADPEGDRTFVFALHPHALTLHIFEEKSLDGLTWFEDGAGRKWAKDLFDTFLYVRSVVRNPWRL